jgi:hypothetical protein
VSGVVILMNAVVSLLVVRVINFAGLALGTSRRLRTRRSC